ncbi:MAG TPA: DNA-3-methyladenine glycosylase I [Prolixibacteraceae bacterium]|nr:DNA-3-methyladenine glycosylase I [Prolixibacteraceae bacterium]
MEKPKSYCEMVMLLDPANVHRIYHDKAYGFQIKEDNELFERLVLEINQAGLSWNTILVKQENFKRAFHHFNIEKVASYQDEDRQRLLNDAGIIRNRLKIDAAIHNARVILSLRKEYGSFKNWLDQHHPMTLPSWTKLFKQTFKFTGGEIVNEFLMSTGYLPGAHIESCVMYHDALRSQPPWNNQ